MTDTLLGYLVHVTSKEENGINIAARAVLNDELEGEIKRHKSAVSEFLASQNVIKSVIANRNDVLEAMVMMGRYYIDNPHAPEDVLDHASFDISRRFANMCSLFRSFLDHFDRYFVKNFGEGSKEYATWSASKSREYDTHQAYSIVYGMRNYIQHYDMPPLSLRVREQAGVEGIEMTINLSISALMEDKKFRGKFADKIDIVEAGLPLFNLIDEWSKCFSRIVDEANAIRCKDARVSGKYILDLRSRLNIPPEGRIAIAHLPATSPGVKLEKLDMRLDWISEDRARYVLSDKALISSQREIPTEGEV